MRCINTILLLMLSTCCQLTASAQGLIPRAGISLSSIQDNSYSLSLNDRYTKHDIDPMPGFTVGIGYRVTISRREESGILFQPEINFIQKGYKTEDKMIIFTEQENQTTVTMETFQLHYMEVTLLLNWMFGSGDTRFHFIFGPSLALLTGGTYKRRSSSSSQGVAVTGTSSGKIKFAEQPPENTSDYYFNNYMDIGIQSGCGVTLFEKAIIDIRYGMGLLDLQKGLSSRTMTWQLTVGVPLVFKQ